MENVLKYLLFSVLLIQNGLSFAQNAEQLGIASYYDDAFDGKKTASKEIYKKAKFTAAHKEFPFGTYIRVTRLDNKKKCSRKS